MKLTEITNIENIVNKVIVYHLFMFLKYHGDNFNFCDFESIVNEFVKIELEKNVSILFRKKVYDDVIEYADNYVTVSLNDMPVEILNTIIKEN